MVEYQVDVVILRPKDGAKARKVMVYDVVNRGMRLLSMFSGGDPGDGLLFRQGYTLVWSGWQGDLTASGLVKARFPVAQGVTGRVATETIFDNATGNRMALPYAAASLEQAQAQLTVQAVTDSPARTIPAADWKFTGERQIELVRPAGSDAGAIYRFSYTAKDPVVMGLGFAATRDLVSWLRKAPAAQGNPLGDIGRYQTAVGFGGSQSGRYLRDFLWQGFNRDGAGKRVFDGVIPFIPGARRTFTNFRFAEPGRFSRQHEDHGVPGFDFPFTYASLKDPVTGKRDGILASCTRTSTCPRIMHIDTSAEFWQAGSSLVGTGGTARDVALPANVRAYMITGGAHAPGMMMPACRYPANALQLHARGAKSADPHGRLDHQRHRAARQPVAKCRQEANWCRWRRCAVRRCPRQASPGPKWSTVRSVHPARPHGRCWCRRSTPTATTPAAFVCLPSRHHRAPISDGICARPATPKATCACWREATSPSPRTLHRARAIRGSRWPNAIPGPASRRTCNSPRSPV